MGVVVYDWKNFTLQELVLHMKKVLGHQKVVSIAVIAPGNKPGCVGRWLTGARAVGLGVAGGGWCVRVWL